MDQAEGTASAKTPRQEQLEMFVEHGGGQSSWPGVGEGKRWEARTFLGGGGWGQQSCGRTILDTDMDLPVR